MSSPFLEKRKPIAVTLRDNLPHWHQQGKIQFVTFRLADSLPQIAIQEIKRKIDDFNHNHPKPWDEATAAEYQKNISDRYEKYLDAGYGSCHLRNSKYRKHLSTAIHYFDNVSYNLIAYVIMPNHVHLLFRLIDCNTPDKIVHSIKRNSAIGINRMRGETGSFWMRRYFDRIVRDEADLIKYVEYIRYNPTYLHKDEFELYIHPDYEW